MKRIDVGCGAGRRPAPDYDMYCDVIEPREGILLPEPYVQCPIEEMPFETGEFHYARCHHVIEHCTDPDKACGELIRIARAGRISFPPMQAEIMFGRIDHRWFVCVDKGRLLFIKKRHPSYGIPRQWTNCQLNVDFDWEVSFKWLVVR